MSTPLLKYLGIACAIISSVLSSLAWVYQGEAVKHLGPFATVSGLGLISSAILFLYLVAAKKLPTFEQLWSNRKDLLIVTIIRPLLGSILFNLALLQTSGIKLMFFTKLEPYFVLFLAWIFERTLVNRRQIVLLAVHICGAVILSTNGEFSLGQTQLGDLLVIGTVLMMSFAYAPSTRLVKSMNPLGANFVTLFTAGVISLPLAIIYTPTPILELPSAGWHNLFIALLMFQVIGLTLWFVALKFMQGWIVSALRAVGPVIAAPFAFLFFGQSLSCFQVGGAVLVLATSALIAREHVSQKTKVPSSEE